MLYSLRFVLIWLGSPRPHFNLGRKAQEVSRQRKGKAIPAHIGLEVTWELGNRTLFSWGVKKLSMLEGWLMTGNQIGGPRLTG